MTLANLAAAGAPIKAAHYYEPPGEPSKPRAGFEFLKIGDRDPLEGAVWIVPGAITERTVTILAGKWGARKTFLAIDWGCRVAAGLQIGGKQVKQGGTLYLAGEGRDGLARRVCAWSAHNDVDGASLPFRYCERVPDMRTAEEFELACKGIDAVKGELGELRLIIVDTLAKALGGGADTEVTDVAPALRNFEKLRDRYDCAVLVLHHPPRGEEIRARGLGQIEADTDGSLILEWDDAAGVGTVRATKLKDGSTETTICFRTELIDLGPHNIDGSRVTSLAVEYVDAPKRQKPAARERWPASLRLFRDVVTEALGEHGADRRVGSDGPIVKMVDVEKVRPEFYRRHATGEDRSEKAMAAKRQAFGRVIKSAVAAKLICSQPIDGVELIWLPK
jgi:hypothetical protein